MHLHRPFRILQSLDNPRSSRVLFEDFLPPAESHPWEKRAIVVGYVLDE